MKARFFYFIMVSLSSAHLCWAQDPATESSPLYKTQYTTSESSLTLDLTYDGQKLSFRSQGRHLFELRLDEFENFLQVARDLESFENRIAGSVEGLKIFGSIFLGFSSSGLKVGGTILSNVARFSVSSAPLFLPKYPKDPQILRLSKNDFPYFLHPKNYSRWALPKRDLQLLISALEGVHTEYLKRMEGVLNYQSSLADPFSLQCEWLSKDRLLVTNSRDDLHFEARIEEESEQRLLIDLHLNEDSSQALFQNLHPFFGLSERDRSLAKFEFTKRGFSLVGLDVVAKFASTHFHHYPLNQILATIGRRTRTVNTSWIVPQHKKVTKLYQMSQNLAECLK